MDFSQGFCRQSDIQDNNYLNCQAGKLQEAPVHVNFDRRQWSERGVMSHSQTLACIGIVLTPTPTGK